MTQDQEIAGLKLKVRALEWTVGTLVCWIAASSLGVIRVDEASKLLNVLNGHEPAPKPEKLKAPDDRHLRGLQGD